MRFVAAISHEPPWFVARCLEVEVTSQGPSAAAALANLGEALELRFEDEPLAEPIEPVTIALVDITA